MIGIKTGGRQKGTPNKTTKEIRTLVKAIVVQELEQLAGKLNELTTTERVQVLKLLIGYAAPPLKPKDATWDEAIEDW